MEDLNFFSIYQGSIKERKDEKIYIYAAAALLAGIILFTTAFNVVRIFVIGNHIKDYTDRLNTNEMQAQLKEAENINDKLKILGEYEDSLSSVVKEIKGVTLIDDKFLIDVSNAVPNDISFTEWKMDNYELTMKGTTHSRSAVAELEHNLNSLSQFKAINVDKIKVGETVGDDLTFEMTCILKEVR